MLTQNGGSSWTGASRDCATVEDGGGDRENGGAIVFPDAVDEATAQYRAESDPLGRFIETCLIKVEDGRVQATTMHALFSAWAKANGESVWTIKGLGSALRERGFQSKKSDSSFWVGVKLTKGTWDFDTPDGVATGGADRGTYDHADDDDR